MRPRRFRESIPIRQGRATVSRPQGVRSGGGTDEIRWLSPVFGGATSENTGWHLCVESFGYGDGIARVTDVIVARLGGEEPGVDHPAVFPVSLAEPLLRTFNQEGDTVLDPFCGSGQTLLAAKACKRYLRGFD